MDIVSGIKCDNAQCDFNDPTVVYADYPQWINRACPKCGENLLTQEDYDICAQMEMMTEIVEKIPGFKDLLQNAFDESMFKGIGEDGMVSFDTVRDLFKGIMPVTPSSKEEDTPEIKDMKNQPYFSGDCFPYTPPVDIYVEPTKGEAEIVNNVTIKKSKPGDKYYPKGERVGKILEKLIDEEKEQDKLKKKTRRSKNKGNNLLGGIC